MLDQRPAPQEGSILGTVDLVQDPYVVETIGPGGEPITVVLLSRHLSNWLLNIYTHRLVLSSALIKAVPLFSEQLLMQTHDWLRYWEQVIAECSTLNRTPIFPSPKVREHHERGIKKSVRARQWEEGSWNHVLWGWHSSNIHGLKTAQVVCIRHPQDWANKLPVIDVEGTSGALPSHGMYWQLWSLEKRSLEKRSLSSVMWSLVTFSCSNG